MRRARFAQLALAGVVAALLLARSLPPAAAQQPGGVCRDCAKTPQSLGLSGAVSEVAGKLDCDFVPELERELRRHSGGGSGGDAAFVERFLGERPPRAWLEKSRECPTKEPRCVLETVLGSREAALRALVLYHRDSVTLSASQQHNPAGTEQLWSLDEIRKIQGALDVLPAKFRKLRTLKAFHRIADGITDPNDPNTAAIAFSGTSTGSQEGTIRFFGKTFQEPNGPELTILHELFHHVDYSANFNDGQYAHQQIGLGEASGWEQQLTDPRTGETLTRPVWVAKKRDSGFVTRYSETSPREELAELASHYVWAPSQLKERSPAKYELVKSKLFDEKEFTEREPWPELDRLIAGSRVWQSALTSCLALAPGLFFDLHSGRLAVRDGAKSPFFDEFLKSACKPSILSAFEAELGRRPDFCARGGLPALERALNARMDRKELPGAAALLAGKAGFEEARRQCANARDLRAGCAAQTYARNIAGLQPGAPFTPALQKELERVLVPLSNENSGRDSQLPLGDLLRACFKRLKAVDLPASSALVYETGGSCVQAGATCAPCVTGLRELLRAGGYAYEPEQELRMLRLTPVLQRFNATIPEARNEAARACRQTGPEARRACVRQVFKLKFDEIGGRSAAQTEIDLLWSLVEPRI